jgi:transcriptional regulator with XRE-family HTH domain
MRSLYSHGVPGKPPVGDRIRSARADKGWMQKHLAAEVEVEPITVSRWERGATTPDLDVLRLVAEATGKPLSYFVADDAEVASMEQRVAALEESLARIERMLERLGGSRSLDQPRG